MLLQTASRMIVVIGFCWAIFGLLSLLSELKFLVDAMNWGVNYTFSLTLKFLLIELGRRISVVISGYREFVVAIFQLLHLPKLPHLAYDIVGIVAVSCGRGLWLSRRAQQLYRALRQKGAGMDIWFRDFGPDVEVSAVGRMRMMQKRRKRFWPAQWKRYPLLALSQRLSGRIGIVGYLVVYGGVVACILIVLFGIDYAYRAFV